MSSGGLLEPLGERSFFPGALSQGTLNVTGASGSGTANSAGVAKVLAARQGVTSLATATLHGTSGPMGK